MERALPIVETVGTASKKNRVALAVWLADAVPSFMARKIWPKLSQQNDGLGFFHQVAETEPALPNFFRTVIVRTEYGNRLYDPVSCAADIAVTAYSTQMNHAHSGDVAVFRTALNRTKSAIGTMIDFRVYAFFPQPVATSASIECSYSRSTG